MAQSELLEILERHRKWLAKESDGRPADLHGADLHEANLLGADLSEVNLNGADLRYTDLRGADLYKCCLPLWSGGTRIKLDRMQMAQLIYQFCSMECDDSEMLTLQNHCMYLRTSLRNGMEILKNSRRPPRNTCN